MTKVLYMVQYVGDIMQFYEFQRMTLVIVLLGKTFEVF
jgi:hypothetical protein